MRAILALLLALLVTPVEAEERDWRHGLSLLGEIKYPKGFAHFDYANPKAPKGGIVRFGVEGGFDTFNYVPGKGDLASGTTYLYETLMTPAEDEVASDYGLLAESVSRSPDFSSVTYRLRSEARWHDGVPVTPEDVIFSFEMVTKYNPPFHLFYRNVKSVTKTGEREVTFTFDKAGNRELPQIVGQLNILPKHWWEGKDATGKPRDIAQNTLEIPLGSGPYRIKSFEPGRRIVYERVKDYWGRDLNVNLGRFNFDEIRYEHFRDDTVLFEAFKADQFDWHTEISAKTWASGYDVPAVKDGRILRETFPVRGGGQMQGFAMNQRRPLFQDQRVRKALGLLLDFEEMNKLLFFGQYQRVTSYFFGTKLAATGVPEGLEREILESVRDKVPAALFEKPYQIPASGTAEMMRANLREATRLLKEAGYELRDRRMTEVKTGRPMRFEVLLNGPSFERHMLFYKQALDRLGIDMTIRTVDQPQYTARVRDFDFDMLVFDRGQSLTPGNEQRDYWGSEAAGRPGSGNWFGIRDPAVDALIDRVIYAKTREELVAATRALDRVLLWGDHMVPAWTYLFQRTARWDRFGKPDPIPYYSIGFPDSWWFDAEKAARIGTRR